MRSLTDGSRSSTRGPREGDFVNAWPAQVSNSSGIAVDRSGHVFVADQPGGDPRRGRAHLVANVAGIGRLALAGEGVRKVRRRARGAGEVLLPIVPNGIRNGTTWEKLLEKGRARVEAIVTYTPTTPPGAAAATKSRRITLVLERG